MLVVSYGGAHYQETHPSSILIESFPVPPTHFEFPHTIVTPLFSWRELEIFFHDILGAHTYSMMAIIPMATRLPSRHYQSTFITHLGPPYLHTSQFVSHAGWVWRFSFTRNQESVFATIPCIFLPHRDPLNLYDFRRTRACWHYHPLLDTASESQFFSFPESDSKLISTPGPNISALPWTTTLVPNGGRREQIWRDGLRWGVGNCGWERNREERIRVWISVRASREFFYIIRFSLINLLYTWWSWVKIPYSEVLLVQRQLLRRLWMTWETHWVLFRCCVYMIYQLSTSPNSIDFRASKIPFPVSFLLSPPLILTFPLSSLQCLVITLRFSS